MGMLYKRGFTLIELLVVIAIIGLLATVVLASLNSARGGGADAAIKSNLQNFRLSAALVYDQYNCYASGSGSCAGRTMSTCGNSGGIFTHPSTLPQIDAAAVTSGGSGAANCGLRSTAQSYAIAIRLRSDLALAFCVDSTGFAGVKGTPGGPTLTDMRTLIAPNTEPTAYCL